MAVPGALTRWPALRLHIRSKLAPSLRSRVDFHIARYRETDGGAYGRAWVTVDGERRGTWPAPELIALLSDYVDIPPPHALRSETPLWRALAVADRRLDEGTLRAFAASGESDELVRTLHALRLGAA